MGAGAAPRLVLLLPSRLTTVSVGVLFLQALLGRGHTLASLRTHARPRLAPRTSSVCKEPIFPESIISFCRVPPTTIRLEIKYYFRPSKRLY